MSIKLGNTLLAGIATETKSNAHSLLDWKPSDHILNEMSWLRGDTFSWQSGDVYIAVYNHLLADYTNATQKTETVGSYTITYYEATDGHKIILPDQIETAINIYNESGVAWYYILDTTNTRFKLPRSTHGEIVEKYQNGTNWYRVWSDGWCEQGGVVTAPSSAQKGDFLIPFIDTNYTIVASPRYTSGSFWQTPAMIGPYSESQFYYGAYNGSTSNYMSWTACGYARKPTQNSQYKYLYFYVGEFSQSATEQTAGLNASLFNGKLDLDLNNISADGVSYLGTLVSGVIAPYVAQIMIPDWSTSATTYSAGTPAPDDGFVWAFQNGKNMYVNGIQVGSYYLNAGSGWNTPCSSASCYVKRGDVITGAEFYFKPLGSIS